MTFEFPAGWDARGLAAFRRAMLGWFDRARRDLPWRSDRDPYRVWVSEVMLQQTTVAAVVPYFERFLAAFPTVQALAAADEQAVLRHWEGLGYYRRARHLHAAARRLIEEHAGELPDDPAVWAALPGVGRYILGAVLSQAFDRRLPIVEANSLRVLARLFGYPGDPRAGAGKAWVWAAAEAVLPMKRAGDFNQSLMELGALVCTPAAPKCGDCPANRWCVANRDGTQNAIPPRKLTPVVTEVLEAAVVVRDGPRVLFCQRPAGVRWAGMWEFPRVELAANESPADAAARAASELAGLSVSVGSEVLTVRHGVTRFAITLTAFEATRRRGEYQSSFYADGRWVEPAELEKLPTGTAQRKLVREVSRGRRLFS